MPDGWEHTYIAGPGDPSYMELLAERARLREAADRYHADDDGSYHPLTASPDQRRQCGLCDAVAGRSADSDPGCDIHGSGAKCGGGCLGDDYAESRESRPKGRHDG